MNSADKKLASQPFSAAALATILQQFPAVRAWHVALSGGADSVALLHALATIPRETIAPIYAVHINHGLQSEASQWDNFCTRLCADHDIPLTTLKVSIEREQGESLEMAARRVRYAAFSDCLQEREALLTAHHQNDQAETLLLNLLNGAGVTGLAAMQPCRDFSAGYLIRPLLAFTHQQLMDYLEGEKISWVEDPSNQDAVFDRNFLRNEIIPNLESRWPAAVKCIARSARNQREQVSLNRELAEQDLAKASDFCCGGILLRRFQVLSLERQKLLLRHWLGTNPPLINPSEEQLQTILNELIAAAEDAQPQLKLAGAVIRRFDDRLTKSFITEIKPHQQTYKWTLGKPLQIQSLGIWLDPELILNQFSEFDTATELTVQFRQGGEQFKPAGNSHHRKLKQLFQLWRVPVWKRDIIPLVYCQDQLIVVWGYGCSR